MFLEKFLKIFLKFFTGFGLAIFLSGIIYFYFPNLINDIWQTKFFTASLSKSEKQILKTEFENPQEYDNEYNNEYDDDEIIENNLQEFELSEQDILDDIAEQIDIIKSEVEKLIAQKQEEESQEKENKKNKENSEEDLQEDLDKEDDEGDLQEVENNNKAKAVYRKILISEVQIAGISNPQEEFVELYNPNDFEVELTGWYLQRKTKTADSYLTFVPSNLFLNKKIGAKNYLIIAREDNFSLSQVDVWTDNPLTEDNSLILKDPNRDIVDRVGWGLATDFETQATINPTKGLSIGRNLQNNVLIDTDNNFGDFVLQTPTPRGKNLNYVKQVVVIGGGSTPDIIYKKIMISEISLIKGGIFIELFNPNNEDINLTNWYLQRKTAGAENYSSYITKPQFENKIILANNYFLIVRQGSEYENIADIVFDKALTDDNSLILKNPKQEIVDRVGWGLATDFEIQAIENPATDKSLQRKWIELENREQDTDNNFNDFVLQTPTPRAKNINNIIEPPIEPPPQELQDTNSPSVIFDLLGIQTKTSFDVGFEITDILETTSSGVASYILRWSENKENWHEYEEKFIENQPEKFSGVENFSGQDGLTYYFQIKAKDGAENWSKFLPTEPAFTKIELPLTPPPLPELLPIVINEVQISPIEQRFIELYNPNLISIDLTGYYLQRKKQDDVVWGSFVSSTNFEGKMIEPNYYFLISREVVDSDILIDIALKDNESLVLKNSKRDIVDRVGWGQATDFENSPALSPPAGKSISRINGIDTNENSVDFIILDTPTPKSE